MNKGFALFLGFCFLAFGSAAQASAKPASYSPSQLEQLWRPVGHKRRKQVTSNAFHFWAWSRGEAAGYLGPYLAFDGVIIGDPHPRNVFDYRAKNGAAELAVADIDDGGRGPLFLDFARYVTYLEASKLDLKVGKVFEAYLAGLSGYAPEHSAIFDAARAVKRAGIESAHRRYLEKNTLAGKFRYAELRMTPVKQLSDAQRKEVGRLEKILTEKSGLPKVYDVGYRVNDSGSSAGMARYWFLLGSEEAPSRILEAKELAPRSAVDYYEPQAADSERVGEVVDAYSRKGLDETLFGVVKADAYYWVRPRKYQALKLDDEDLTDAELREFAFQVANWMGAMQARQAGGQALLKKLEEDPRAAKKAMESLVRAYLKEIKRLPE